MSSSSIKAIIVDQLDSNRLAVRKKKLAPPAPGEITVRVNAISLNRGEVKRALTVTETGTCPGWDFAGVVEDAASVAGAPKVGTRVVGLVPEGAWAERVRVPLPSIAVIPEEVTDAQAASLPVAGLTALHALRKGGLLIGRLWWRGTVCSPTCCRFWRACLFARPTKRPWPGRRILEQRRHYRR